VFVLCVLMAGCQSMFPRVTDMQLHDCAVKMTWDTLQIADCHVTMTRGN
jgi:hypothetical protein